MSELAERLRSALQQAQRTVHCRPLQVSGELVDVVGLTMQAEGCVAPVGSRCLIESDIARGEAEVVGFAGQRTLLMPVGVIDGLVPGARVTPLGRAVSIPVGDALLGRVIDARGEPLDGAGPLAACRHASLKRAPLNPLERAPIDQPFDVGVRAINALLTLGRGQRVGLFAGSGVGKSALLGMMTQHSEADVTVVALVGERGREVREFVHDTLGPDGLKRAIVVAVPADHPPLMRLQGAQTATAIAEHFRDQGLQVLLLVDSLTRFAQAQREIGLAIGEPPASKGYPPSVFARLPQLVERAGGVREGGSITAIYTVLAEGDDQNDPVVDAVRAVLDGHIVLTRELANAGHFPAIDVSASVSRTRPAVTDAAEQALALRFQQLHATWQAQSDMLRVGLYQAGTDPDLDEAVARREAMLGFLRQRVDEPASLPDSMLALRSVIMPAEAPPQSDPPVDSGTRLNARS